jgi:hydrogenase maturation protease
MHFVLDAFPQTRHRTRAVIVIGMGNEFRHDDAAGLIAARRLRTLGLPAEEHQGDPATLIERWKGINDVMLIDAVWSGAAPGTLHRLDVSGSPLPRHLFLASTHSMGLAEAVELSRVLGTLPARVLVFGVEGKNFRPGIGVSPEVERTLRVLVEDLQAAWAKAEATDLTDLAD